MNAENIDKWEGETVVRKERDSNGRLRSIYRCQMVTNGTQCQITARTSGGFCKGCTSGKHRLNEDHADGDIFVRNGIRYVRTKGQDRRLCSGSFDMCEKQAKKGNLCLTCTPDTIRTPQEVDEDSKMFDGLEEVLAQNDKK